MFQPNQIKNISFKNQIKQRLNNLFTQKKYNEVIRTGLNLFQRSFHDLEIYILVGSSFLLLNNYLQALKIFNYTSKIFPNSPEIYNNLGVTYKFLKEPRKSIKCYKIALGINPDYPEAYNNLGYAYWCLDKFQLAIQNYLRAINLKINYASPYNNIANAYKEISHLSSFNLEKAIDAYKKAILIDPYYADAYTNLSLLYMHLGRFKEAWTDFHWRWHSNEFYSEAYKTNKPKFNLSSNYHHVFIWKEQGIGDQILFARLFNDLRDKDFKIDALVDKKLKPLFQSSFPHINFVDSANEDLIDSHAPMGDLGQFFINNFDDVKARSHPYIKVNQQRTETLKKLLPSDKKICGISWVSVNEDLGRNKSMSLEQLKDILLLPNMVFVDLQYGDTSQERQSFYEKYGVKILKIEEVDNFDDIEGLASLIDLCDCVLSVSNTTVHIAGAIGKPTYLMLPKGKGKLWYWSKEGNQSMWYKSIKIFEQDKIGEWDGVVRETLKLI